MSLTQFLSQICSLVHSSVSLSVSFPRTCSGDGVRFDSNTTRCNFDTGVHVLQVFLQKRCCVTPRAVAEVNNCDVAALVNLLLSTRHAKLLCVTSCFRPHHQQTTQNGFDVTAPTGGAKTRPTYAVNMFHGQVKVSMF